MFKPTRGAICAALALSIGLAPLGAGCSKLPGDKKTQGAVIGGAGGAAAGAVVSKNNRLLGALVGGVLGAGGGYLIGARADKLDEKNRDEALESERRSQRDPAKPEQVDRATTADLNDDGYVTIDEVVAMRNANLSNDEMIDRLERTQQVFELTDQQEDQLSDRGVDKEVIIAMRTMNQDLARTASAEDRRDSERYDDRLDRSERERDLETRSERERREER